jgi:hypothetical protein
MERPTRKLVVIGDSMTYWQATEEPPLDDPRSMPFRIASHLEDLTGDRWSAVNLGEGGRAAFDACKLLRGDEETRSRIAGADAIFFAVCGKDGVTQPFPRGVRMVIGRIPKPYRGQLVRWLKPRLAKVTSHQFQTTRDSLFVRSWRGSIDAIRELNPTAPLICSTPTRPYGPQRWCNFPADWEDPDGFVAKVHELVDAAQVAKVDYIALMEQHMPELEEGWDFLHWPEQMHDRVGRHAAELLAAQLVGDRTKATSAIA